jgi:diguanylate cyclase (GGDEF)-like protein
MMDLDHFKRLNDTYGHAAGDMALQEVGKILRSFFRPEDFCCRYGGEEFLILLPEAITKDVYQRAEALRKQIHTLKLAFQDRPIGTISISIGIAVFPDHGQDMTRILKAADQALYRAKKEGRNRVCIAENTPGQAGETP